MQKDSPSAETLTRTVAADFSTLPLAKQDNEHDCAKKSAQMSAGSTSGTHAANLKARFVSRFCAHFSKNFAKGILA